MVDRLGSPQYTFPVTDHSTTDFFALPVGVLALVFFANPWLIFELTADEWDAMAPEERGELEEQLFEERPELPGVMAEFSRLTTPPPG